MIAIHWFRRDLRIADNHALAEALRSGLPVLPIFIFDDAILKSLPKHDARVEFIYQALEKLHSQFAKHNSSLLVEKGDVKAVFKRLLAKYGIKKVFTNEDYEPEAIERDREVRELLKNHGAEFHALKDQVIFHKDECVKDDGKPYLVFTAYARKWRALHRAQKTKTFASEKLLKHLFTFRSVMPSLKEIGFEAANVPFPKLEFKKSVLEAYAKHRNDLDHEATSRLGLHFRFGTVSIRHAVKVAEAYPVWLNELIWREFFTMILYFKPETVFDPARDLGLTWRKSESDFKRWCEGQTGYPLVDAGMRQLNKVGYMPNRVRMVAASFLTKHLLIHWKKGERYFAEKLLDFELASNVGNWQWVAGTGFDAAPYFRIFNPAIAAKKFDPKSHYIKTWVPEFGTKDYPKPMVDHAFARDRALEAYHKGKNK